MKNLLAIFITILFLKTTHSSASAFQITIDDGNISYYEEARFKNGEINKPFYLRHMVKLISTKMAWL